MGKRFDTRALGQTASRPILALILLVSAACPSCGEGVATAAGKAADRAAAIDVRVLADLQALDERLQETVDKTLASTVSVSVRRSVNGGGFAGVAFGSGVIVSEDGFVLTAAHVAGRANQPVTFRLADGRIAYGKTLGLNEDLDIGLLKINGAGPWPHLRMSSSADVREGDWCVASGHPGGFDPKSPAQIRLGRILKAAPKAYLTDCTLVGGDSGGPLVNINGEVIAVHSRIGTDLTTNLHIPVDRYTESWERLVDGDVWGLLRTVRPWIGVERDPRSTIAKIERVRLQSPAERAGLQVGDVIVRFADRQVSEFDDLRRFVSEHEPGQKVTVQVLRGEVTIESLLEIGAQEIQDSQDSQTRDDAELLRDWLQHLDGRRRGGRAVSRIGKNSDQVKQAFRDAVAGASRATVRVQSDGSDVALGTVVDADGLILTKASETNGELRCLFRGSRWFRVTKISESRQYDLALLKADRRLPVFNMQATANAHPGMLLASSSMNNWPLAVGVASSGPLAIPSEGKLGIRMEDGGNRPFVTQIVAESGAEKAGVRIGDLVLAVGKQPVKTKSDLIKLIGRHYPGEQLTVRLQREGQLLELDVQLGRYSEFDEALADFAEFVGGQLSERRTGFPTVLQHDTPLLPRDCGGPVVDSRGQFIGINIARATRTSSYLLPAAEVQVVLGQLLKSRTDVQSSAANLQTVGVGQELSVAAP